jgi:hypothetical protein
MCSLCLFPGHFKKNKYQLIYAFLEYMNLLFILLKPDLNDALHSAHCSSCAFTVFKFSLRFHHPFTFGPAQLHPVTTGA